VPDYGSLAAYHDAVARGRSPWPVSELLAQVYSHASGFEPGTIGCIRMWVICSSVN
jgi:hypothetical protein